MNAQRSDKNPNAPRGETVGQDWPAYRYGPNGQAKVFIKPEDVPAGWADHPKGVGKDANPYKAEDDIADREARLAAREAALAEREKALKTVNLKALKDEIAAAPKGKRPVMTLKGAPQPLVTLGDDEDESDDE